MMMMMSFYLFLQKQKIGAETLPSVCVLLFHQVQISLVTQWLRKRPSQSVAVPLASGSNSSRRTIVSFQSVGSKPRMSCVAQYNTPSHLTFASLPSASLAPSVTTISPHFSLIQPSSSARAWLPCTRAEGGGEDTSRVGADRPNIAAPVSPHKSMPPAQQSKL